jgi:hypothetical protein
MIQLQHISQEEEEEEEEKKKLQQAKLHIVTFLLQCLSNFTLFSWAYTKLHI